MGKQPYRNIAKQYIYLQPSIGPSYKQNIIPIDTANTEINLNTLICTINKSVAINRSETCAFTSHIKIN